MPWKRAVRWLGEGRGSQSSVPAVTEGWLGADQVSQPQFSHCQDRNHHSHWIYFRDISESVIKYVSYEHFPAEISKDSGIFMNNISNLLCCQLSPRTRAGTKKLDKRLAVSVFLSIYMPLGM